MKKAPLYILSAFILFNCSWAFAQTGKGSFMVGELTHLSLYGPVANPMNLGFSTITQKSDDEGTTGDTYKILSVNLIPKAGYFVIDNLLLGLDMTLSSNHSKAVEEEYRSCNTILMMGPFVRYYIPLSKIYPFAEISGSLGKEVIKFEYEGNELQSYKTGIRIMSAGLGIAIPAGENLLFDLIAGYNSMVEKNKENNDSNRKEVTNSFGLKFGFSIFL